MYKNIEPSKTAGRWSTMTENLRMFLPDLMLRHHHLYNTLENYDI